MMLLEYRVPVPTWAMPYLVNGDVSGLDEEDIKIIDNWYQNVVDNYMEPGEILIISPHDDVEYFTWHPAFGEACMVTSFDFAVIGKEV